MLFAGTGHLTFARQEFQAQVPPWVPLDVDFVVLASGVVEIAVGAALLAAWRQPAEPSSALRPVCSSSRSSPATSPSSPSGATPSVWTATAPGPLACSSSRCSSPGRCGRPTRSGSGAGEG
ncbi:hypothetical protein [Janibacter melonis]|uniref:hypothetical protein n=1 Tax=Janibacter melonis TaxID=262209 RepID=UPI0027D9FC29|nr:hypothetical protein [Janibacter melonis]